jgi:eukaryotic-like serine/threonine-protein kinase
VTRAFVGRDRELAELRAGLQDAIGGRGRLFLVTGGPGIGKTALADQLATHAAGQGMRVLWGRCWEGGGTPPYWPWVQLIGTVAEGYDGETLASYMGQGAPHVARLVPELSERVGGTAAASGSLPGSDAARFYLFEAIARLFRNASSDAPLLLVLDDLQAADSSTLLLLRFLARDVRACRLLVVGTCRDVDAVRPAEAAGAFGELVREGDLLRLGGLGRGEVADLITELSGIMADAEKVAAICEATEGNPLFVREVVRLVASASELDRPGRVRVPIPEGVRAVIRQRLVPLSADAVQVLSAAAVVGRDFELFLIGHASDLPLDRVLSGLSEAVALGVVTEEPSTAGQFRFSHPLMRELIYKELPIPARMQLHRLVGEAIERRYRSDSGPHLAQLAHHFAQAAAAGQGTKALQYARRAGDRAMETCAYREAAAEYRRALQALESAGPDEAGRCELLLRLGDAQARAGAYQKAKASYLQAAEIARTLGSPRQLARAALGFGEPQVEGSLVNRHLIALLQEALGGLSDKDDPLRARMLARLALELTFSGETELRESLSREAVDMARRLGDIAALGSALRARWVARWEPEGLDERAGLAEELLRLARETDDRELELLGRARRIACSLERGHIGEVDADIAAHARLADELRMPVYQWHAATMRAMLALLRGSFQEGERLAGQALSLQAGRATPQFAHLYQLALIRWEQGRLGELRESWQ